MKKKFLSSLIAISITMSMGVPVFAANQTVQGASPQSGTVPVAGNIQGASPQSGTVPVAGNIGKYIPQPQPGTEINVSIPTSMAFDVGYNKYSPKSNLKSADYTITNNGVTSIAVTSQYNVTNSDGVTLTTPGKVNPTDSNLELALSLNVGQTANPTTPWIQSVTDKSTGNTINIASKSTEHMKFSATEQGLANITQHAKNGELTSEKNIKGNLIFTFNAVDNENIVSSMDVSIASNPITSTVTLKNKILSITNDSPYTAINSYSINNNDYTSISDSSDKCTKNKIEIKNLKIGDIVEFKGQEPYYFGSINLSDGINYKFKNNLGNQKTIKIKILGSDSFELITNDDFIKYNY